jgi:hypothetical protein
MVRDSDIFKDGDVVIGFSGHGRYGREEQQKTNQKIAGVTMDHGVFLFDIVVQGLTAATR